MYPGVGVLVVVVVRLAEPLPEGPVAARVVQICHKGPDWAGSREKKR